MSEKRSFFSELKRRNVYKVAVAYAVGSWLLIQIATQVFPFFEIPNWAVRLVVIVLVIGFPIALILSWAFEITPEGIKRESEVAPGQSIMPQTGRRIVGLTIIAAIIAAALFLFQFVHSKRSTSVESTNPSGAGQIQAKSIAVLPFENLSDDKANAYFAEGIQDEILTRLSKIAVLKVISRTSTQKYKSAPDNLRDIGKQLGVAHLLEGSVQRIGNAVHISVQLIRAATDEHVWAESYNRKLDDVFGVEGEVASAIADQLNAKLTGAEQKAVTEKPTQNTAAYDAYLRGLTLERNEYSYTAYQQVVRDYIEAVRLDPNFALAWARLAAVRSFLFFNRIEPNENTAAAVKEAADRAMQLAPEAGESWVAQGAYRYRVQRDFEGALAAYQEAQKRLPNTSFVYEYMAFVQRRVGRWHDAETSYKKALELDPRDIQLLSSVSGEFYLYLRRFDEALAIANRAVEIAPDWSPARANKASILQAAGRLVEGADELKQIPADSTEDFVVGAHVTQALYEHHFDTAIEVVERKLRSIPAGQPLDSFTENILMQLGLCQKWSGRDEDARRTFTRVVEAIKPTPQTVVVPEANGRPVTLAFAYAGLGEKDKALQQARDAIKDYDKDAVTKPFSENALAIIQAQFGDLDSAMAALPRLLEVPAGIALSDLKFNPAWDPLRKDPRFQKLIADSESKK